MPYFKFKPNAVITAYFPQLLKQEWWLGAKNLEGNIQLLDHSISPSLKQLLISENDVEAESAVDPTAASKQV